MGTSLTKRSITRW